MRLLLLLITTGLLAAPPAHAGKSFFDVVTDLFDGDQPEEPDPSVTLQAPFAYDPNRTIEKDAPLPVNAVPLNQPHRTAKEIGQWLMITTSDLLTFKAGDAEAEIKAESGYFAQTGEAQYREFLQANSMLQVINSGRFHMQAIVSDNPVLLNEASQGGIYRWLYEVPVIVSYIRVSGFSYKQETPVSQKLNLTLQIRRIESDDSSFGGEHGVVIEIWKGSVESMDKG